MWCLPFELANKIKQAIRTGEINPERLNAMTSAERRAFLAEIVGEENAKQINLSFEKKLLLVNQERAMYDWARAITGLSKAEKEATLAKIRETYAKKESRLYEPKENEKFLDEIVSDVISKSGTTIDQPAIKMVTEAVLNTPYSYRTFHGIGEDTIHDKDKVKDILELLMKTGYVEMKKNRRGNDIWKGNYHNKRSE